MIPRDTEMAGEDDFDARVNRGGNSYTVQYNHGPNGERVEGVNAQNNENHYERVNTMQSGNRKWLIARWLLLFLFIVTVLVLLILIQLEMTANKPTSAPIESPAKAKSCNDLISEGITKDGLYEIQTDKDYLKFHTYCDMTTDGGGWTLVASIHENDIKAKCDSHDLWSLFSTRENVVQLEKDAWENDRTFGEVNEPAKGDYKNRAYFQMNASNVMIWHVPNGVHLDGIKKSSTFRYRTTNSFLQKYGGNLRTLYHEHYPIKPLTESQYEEVLKNKTVRALAALKKRAIDIDRHVTYSHEYTYDNQFGDRITGDPMFGSWGNQVSFNCWYSGVTLQYGTYQKCENSRIIASADTYPFFVVGALVNEDRKVYQYYLRVTSYRPVSSRNYRYSTKVLQSGNYKLQYLMVQYYDTGYSTLCEYYFTITNTKDWNSIPPSSFVRSGTSTGYTNYKYSYVYAQGSPSNFVMGYILLSRENGRIVDTDTADEIGDEILQEFSKLPDLFHGFATGGMSLTVPVQFDKGSNKEVLDTVPPNFRSSVQAGFLQFRPYNVYGYPNALCPGIKTNFSFPEYICIGGVSDSKNAYGTCGDLAGWEGQSISISSYYYGTATPGPATGTSHTHNDISTSFLIFYR